MKSLIELLAFASMIFFTPGERDQYNYEIGEGELPRPAGQQKEQQKEKER